MRRTLKVAVAALLMVAGVSAPAMATIVNVGGGTWNYGTSYVFPAGKSVWSHYVHPSLYHSATAICASTNRKIYATANNWANADVTCGSFDSAAEYWATY